jgi:4-hydroxybenzoate polyprenyltransferase
MLIQALLAFVILLTFYTNAIILGVIALFPVLLSPFAIRFTWWPQVFLGIAFNWGALLGWTAHTGSLAWPAFILYLSGITWTLFYDTMYAHQDKEDDALIGIKSTARLFQENTPKWMLGFLIATVSFMGAAAILVTLDRSPLSLVIALAGPWAMGWHLTWQLRVMDMDNPDNLLKLFHTNRDAGLIALLFFAIAYFV